MKKEYEKMEQDEQQAVRAYTGWLGLELIPLVRTVLTDLHPMTLRQIHYAVLSKRIIGYTNALADYKRLTRATTVARRRYRSYVLKSAPPHLIPPDCIPPHWIADETPESEMVSRWENMDGYLDTLKHRCGRDSGQDQPHYCEVWSEKGSILRVIRPIVQELGVTVRVCYGLGSTQIERQIGEHFKAIRKDISVFYLGDHWPSDHDIECAINTRVRQSSGRDFVMKRLAIHADDIGTFGLPLQRIKPTGSWVGGFERRFTANATTVEIDALPVDELRRRVRAEIEDLMSLTSGTVSSSRSKSNSIA